MQKSVFWRITLFFNLKNPSVSLYYLYVIKPKTGVLIYSMNSIALELGVIAVLLLFGVFSSRLSSRLNMPVLLLFMGAGILLANNQEFSAAIPGGSTVHLANIIGTVAMIFILYSGGLETDMRSVKKIFIPGILLSTAGVFITALALACGAYFILNWSPAWCFLLGAVVSSTDAAAVFSILRSKGVSLRGNLAPVLEFESGSNDPMAALLTIFMVGFMSNPGDTPAWMLLIQIPLKLALGTACGYGIGRLGCWLFNRARLEYEGLYFVLGVAVVLLSYGITEYLYGNGFMAAYVAGLTMGNKRYNYQKSQVRFNNGLAWLMQVAMFTVLGMLININQLFFSPSGSIWDQIWLRGLMLAAVLMFIARPLAVFTTLSGSRFSYRERLFISWVGLRGSAPIVLATFPLTAKLQGVEVPSENAVVLFNLVFCLVITSVMIQGKTLMPLAKLLKLDSPLLDKERMPLELEETGVLSSAMHEFDVHDDSPCLNRTLAELNLPDGIRVMLIRRNNSFIMPRGNTKIILHDGLLLMGERGVMHDMAEEYFPGNDYYED